MAPSNEAFAFGCSNGSIFIYTRLGNQVSETAEESERMLILCSPSTASLAMSVLIMIGKSTPLRTWHITHQLDGLRQSAVGLFRFGM